MRSDRPRILVPFSAAEAIGLQEAAAVAGRHPDTIRRWCPEFHIGRMIGGTWRVSKVALAMMLDGEEDALQAYLAGDRSGPLVAPYYERLGL